MARREHITNFFLNLMRMHFLANPNAAESKLSLDFRGTLMQI